MQKHFETVIKEMETAEKMLLKEYAEIRAGRITPAYLDGIVVEAYDMKTPLNQLANISAPQARLLVIEPWDKSVIKNVEKAILKANIGVTPTNDGSKIRLAFPDLSEEERKKITQRVEQITEKFREEIRGLRRKAREKIKEQEKNKEISEDEKFRLEEELQKLTDKYIGIINDHLKKKEIEIMTI